MFRIVALLNAIAFGTPFKLPDISTTSAASMATSVPVPMAKPTSACAKAGASLIPSPTKAKRPYCFAIGELCPLCLRVKPLPQLHQCSAFGNRLRRMMVVSCNHGNLET